MVGVDFVLRKTIRQENVGSEDQLHVDSAMKLDINKSFAMSLQNRIVARKAQMKTIVTQSVTLTQLLTSLKVVFRCQHPTVKVRNNQKMKEMSQNVV